MIHKIYAFLVMFSFILVKSQVGINSPTPRTTLDIAGKPNDINTTDGIIIPTISKADLAKKSNTTYTNNQNGTLVFINDITAPPAAPIPPSLSQVSNINSIGFYYFNSATSRWKPIDNFYSSDGRLSGQRIVNQDTNSLFYVDNFPTIGTTTQSAAIEPSNNSITFGASGTTDTAPSMVINPVTRRTGINTSKPKSTFEINAPLYSTSQLADGIIIPRIAKAELHTKMNVTPATYITGDVTNYSALRDNTHVGTLLYVFHTSSVSSLPSMVNVTRDGFYYFDENGVWQRLINTYDADGTNDAWVNNPTQSRVEIGTTSSGGARDSKNNVSVQDDGRLNIGVSGSADAGIHLVGDGDGWKDDIRLDSYSGTSSDTPAANFRFYASRGTQLVPSNISNNDTLGQITFTGRVNNGWTALNRIWSQYKLDGTNHKSNLVLSNSTTSAYDLVIDPNGNTGIGTSTPNINAKLEINSTDKGLLLPRVSLTASGNSSPLTAHVAGMEVYNTATNTSVSGQEVYPGKYINDGSKWMRQMTVNDNRIIFGGDGKDFIPTPIVASIPASPSVATITNLSNVISFTLDRPSYVEFNGNISTAYTATSDTAITDGRNRLSIIYWTFTSLPPQAISAGYIVGGQYARATTNYSNYYNSILNTTHNTGNFFATPNGKFLLPAGSYSVQLRAVGAEISISYNISYGEASYDAASITVTAAR